MDDINERLAELLNDPESLNRVREMAENILGNNDKKETPPISGVFLCANNVPIISFFIFLLIEIFLYHFYAE